VLPVALLIIGSNGILAILLPYTAETYPLRIRGRATGWVAGCSKLGGILAQGLSVLAVAPVFGVAALAVMAPVVLAMAMIGWFGSETRDRDLRELDKIAV
jgi:putative MFS transporter